MIDRCPTCHGKRTLMGMGGMVKNCHHCKGVGHIKVEEKEPDCKIEIKGRGRPRRVKDEREKDQA
jgi:hypothetical protein